MCHLLLKWHKNEHKKGQFEPAGLGKLIEKQFSKKLPDSEWGSEYPDGVNILI
jgi:hypothetical protein